MAGLFDDLPEAKTTGLFDDLPNASAPDHQEPGRWTRQPEGVKEWAKFMVGGVLHPIKQAETFVESVSSSVAGKPLRLLVRPAEVMESKAIDAPRIPPAKTTAGQIAAGVGNTLIEFAEFFFTPEGAMTLGIGGLKKELQRLILSDYAADMAIHAPEQLQGAIVAAKEGRIQEAAEKATAGIGGSFLSARITGHMTAKPTVKETANANDIVEPEKMVEQATAKAEVSGAPATAEALKELTPKAGKEPPVTEAPKGEQPPAPEPVKEPASPFDDLPDAPKPTPTALKNAMIERDRQAMGLQPFEEVARQDYREAWDEAMTKMDREPLAQDQLIAELKAKPRALKDAQESALLHHRMIELKNEHARATGELAKAHEEGRTEDAAAVQSLVDALSDQVLELTDITKAAGREWGRTGLARQQLIADDFSYIGLETQKRAAVGGRRLTPEEKGDLVKLASAYEAKMQELQRQLMEASVGRAMAGQKYSPKILAQLERFATKMDQKAAEASTRLKEKLARTSAGVDPTILADVAIIGAAKITRGAVDFAAWSDAMIKDVGEWLRPELQAAWDASNKLLDQEISEVPAVASKAKSTATKKATTVNKTRGELSKLEADFRQDLQKDRLARSTPAQKATRELQRGLSSFRSLKTAFDLSAILRQGGFIVFGHPLRGAKAAAEARTFLAKYGEGKARELEAAREASPNAPLYERAKLYFAPLDAVLKGREEAYLSSWVENWPGIKGSQRSYVSILNKLRQDTFDGYVENARASGKPLTPLEMEVMANYINVATGRGALWKMEKAADAMAAVFFSPRLVASRFQVLLGQPLWRGTARTRRLIAAEYARTLMGIAAFYALADLALSDGTVEDDPRSSDFGKRKIGNTRIDPLMGLSQTTVFLSRMTTGEKKALTGEIQNLREPKFGRPDSMEVLGKFMRSKLAPVPGTVLNIVRGENVVGEPVTPESVAMDLTVPLSMQDIYDVMKEHGVPEGTAISMLSLLGMSVQNFRDKREPQEPQK